MFSLAHTALNQHREAIHCYMKALELDPSNDSYKNNLELAEQQLRETVREILRFFCFTEGGGTAQTLATIVTHFTKGSGTQTRLLYVLKMSCYIMKL